MLKRTVVEKIFKNTDFYRSYILTTNNTFAAVPEELLDKIEIKDEVTIFSSNSLSYNGFSSIVIETPRSALSIK